MSVSISTGLSEGRGANSELRALGRVRAANPVSHALERRQPTRRQEPVADRQHEPRQPPQERGTREAAHEQVEHLFLLTWGLQFDSQSKLFLFLLAIFISDFLVFDFISTNEAPSHVYTTLDGDTFPDEKCLIWLKKISMISQKRNRL